MTFGHDSIKESEIDFNLIFASLSDTVMRSYMDSVTFSQINNLTRAVVDEGKELESAIAFHRAGNPQKPQALNGRDHNVRTVLYVGVFLQEHFFHRSNFSLYRCGFSNIREFGQLPCIKSAHHIDHAPEPCPLQ